MSTLSLLPKPLPPTPASVAPGVVVVFFRVRTAVAAYAGAAGTRVTAAEAATRTPMSARTACPRTSRPAFPHVDIHLGNRPLRCARLTDSSRKHPDQDEEGPVWESP